MNKSAGHFICIKRRFRANSLTMPRRVVPFTLLLTLAFGLACARRVEPVHSGSEPLTQVVNINTAPIEELQKIPHIGESLARKIVEHRETNGPFRRAEHLMLIQGISDKRFRKIRPLVRAE